MILQYWSFFRHCSVSTVRWNARPCGLRNATWLSIIVSTIMCPWGPSVVLARELIANGGFEDGAEQWDSEFQGDGDWYLDTVGSFTPVSDMPTGAEGGGRDDYFVSDQEGAATLTLFQSFNVPSGATSVILSYDMFVNDWSNQSAFDPRQHARVDILKAGTSPFDIGDGVIFNTFVGTDGGPLPNPFSRYEFDITPFVEPGGEFQIRFLAVNAFQNINQGVDNVSIRAVPEPTARTLALAGLGVWVCWVWGQVLCRSLFLQILA